MSQERISVPIEDRPTSSPAVPIEDRPTSSPAGTGHDQYSEPIEETEKLSIVVHEKTQGNPNKISERFKLLNNALIDSKAGQSDPNIIQTVPSMLRENQKFVKYYDPMFVAVGPIHHRNPKLQQAEKLKLRLAKGFMNEYHSNQSAEQYQEKLYENIKKEINYLKNRYEDDAIKSYNDEELAWMFFVDGCAILQFLQCITLAHGEVRDKMLNLFMIKNHHVAFAQQDLLLLENQLPFQVLEILIQTTDESMRNKLNSGIRAFISENMMMSTEESCPTKGDTKEKQTEAGSPAHLLDLLRKMIIGKKQEVEPSFCIRLMNKCAKQQSTTKIPSFRNVMELKAAGIQLNPCPINKRSSLTKINFRRMFFDGHLELHPIVVDDSTAPKFLNLVAYEMSPGFANEFEITSYICFLDSLIDEPGDVKELRDAGILHNAMGSDKNLAILFNEISTDLVPNPRVYYDIKERIQRHCDGKFFKHIAEFKYVHFTSPWSFLAFVGAIFALVMTFLQTWKAMTDDSTCKCIILNSTKTG